MDLPVRKLHRLKNYDYSQSGYYFITICTQNKKNILASLTGNIVAGVPVDTLPTAAGEIVTKAWLKLSTLDPNITAGDFCLMPNHIHGIIMIENQPWEADAAERSSRRSLQSLIRGFKSATAREYNKIVPQDMKNTLWQSSFYDRVIRNPEMLYEIQKYIQENPLKWQEDELYTTSECPQ